MKTTHFCMIFRFKMGGYDTWHCFNRFYLCVYFFTWKKEERNKHKQKSSKMSLTIHSMVKFIRSQFLFHIHIIVWKYFWMYWFLVFKWLHKRKHTQSRGKANYLRIFGSFFPLFSLYSMISLLTDKYIRHYFN